MKKILIYVVALIVFFIVYTASIAFVAGPGLMVFLNSDSWEIVGTRFFVVLFFFGGVASVLAGLGTWLEK